jgi:hypothetical protein
MDSNVFRTTRTPGIEKGFDGTAQRPTIKSTNFGSDGGTLGSRHKQLPSQLPQGFGILNLAEI